MTADEIKALVERLKSKRKMHLANASDIECLNAIESLSDQLLAKTALADLYAASLRKVEAEVDDLKRDDELSLHAMYEDACIQANKNALDAERYRWLRELDPNFHIRNRMVEMARFYGETLDEQIDAARSQLKEGV